MADVLRCDYDRCGNVFDGRTVLTIQVAMRPSMDERLFGKPVRFGTFCSARCVSAFFAAEISHYQTLQASDADEQQLRQMEYHNRAQRGQGVVVAPGSNPQATAQQIARRVAETSRSGGIPW